MNNFRFLKNKYACALSKLIKTTECNQRFEIVLDQVVASILTDYITNQVYQSGYFAKSNFRNKNIIFYNDQIQFRLMFIMKEVYLLARVVVISLINLSIVRKKSANKKFNLIYSLTLEQGWVDEKRNSSRFFDSFFKDEEFVNLVEIKNFNRFIKRQNRTIFVSNILGYLIGITEFSLRLKLVRKITKLIIKEFLYFLKNPNCIIGAARFYEGILTKFLIDNLNLFTKNVSTQTLLAHNPGLFYFENPLQNEMLWYSDNSVPIVPKGNSHEIAFYLGYLENTRVGSHYVWTEHFASILESFNSSAKMVLIEPFIFLDSYPLKEVSHDFSTEIKIVVTYFPITPSSFSINSIYSENTMIEDLNNLVNITRELLENNLEIEVNIKLKRKTNTQHSSKYIKLINFYEEKYPWFKTSNANSDTCSLINASDLTIASPYTSVGLIAKKLHKKVVFYSSARNYGLKKQYENIEVVSSTKRLKNLIKSCNYYSGEAN